MYFSFCGTKTVGVETVDGFAGGSFKVGGNMSVVPGTVGGTIAGGGMIRFGGGSVTNGGGATPLSGGGNDKSTIEGRKGRGCCGKGVP